MSDAQLQELASSVAAGRGDAMSPEAMEFAALAAILAARLLKAQAECERLRGLIG